jgi:GNAT superfamily N-acetyltransferase
VQVRDHSDAQDTLAIQDLASRRWPGGWHPGGLGWALARGQLADRVVVFNDADRGGDGGGSAGRTVAWAALGMDEPDYHLVQTDPGRPEVTSELVAWLVDHSPSSDVRIEVDRSDVALVAAVEHHGLRPRTDGDVLGLRRAARPEPLGLPAGYTIRATTSDELDERVEVHRAAWLPSTLPYAALHRSPTEPGATSSFDRAAYDSVRATGLYRQDLDLVALEPGGAMVGCCIIWLDPHTGSAEVEPMGVVPEHRGRGLAPALCRAAAAAVAELGGTQLFINTGPRAEYPSPGRAYLSAGFDIFTRACLYGPA